MPETPRQRVVDTSTFGHGFWTFSARRVDLDLGDVRNGSLLSTSITSLDSVSAALSTPTRTCGHASFATIASMSAAEGSTVEVAADLFLIVLRP